MDLHNLHRTSPSSQQDPKPPQGIQKELDEARTHAAHWQAETERMDRIARETMDKLQSKREAKRALTAELESWKARYRELSQAGVSGQAAHRELEQARTTVQQQDKTIKELKSVVQDLSKKAGQLERVQQVIQQHEDEREGLKERLRIGGEAYRKLQALEPKLAASERLEKELAASERRRREVEPLLAAKEAELVARIRQADIDAAKSRQADSELAGAREKLRAAVQDASARAARSQACEDMLARAEQVLATCSQLHASKGDPLAEALQETTATIAGFLAKQGV